MSSLTLLPPTAPPPPLKRTRESLVNTAVTDSFKCGEIFVTNNARKWTFCCVHCDKPSSDIGTFICHIRLEHLNGGPIDLGKSYSAIESTCNLLTSRVSATPHNDSTPTAAACRETIEIFEAKNTIHDDEQPTQSQSDSIVYEQTKDHSKVINNSDVTLLKQSPAGNENQNLLDPDKEMSMQNNIIEKNESVKGEPLKNTHITLCKEKDNLLAFSANDHGANDELPMGKEGANFFNVTLLQQSDENKNPATMTDDPAADNEKQSVESCDVFKEKTIISECENLQTSASKIRKISDDTSLGQIPASEEMENNSNKNTHVRNESLVNQDQQLLEEVFYIAHVDDNDDNDTEEDDDDDSDNNDADYENSSLTGEPLTNFKCLFCYKIFDNEILLVDHLKTKHHFRNNDKKYPYHCDVCNKGFKSKHGMQGHSRLHQARNQKQCPICLLSHDYKYFVQHIMIHESETCFPCQVCGQIYDSHEKRLNHWRNHEIVYPFKCSYCFRRFKKEGYLLKHQAYHKRLKCDFCKIEFYSKYRVRHLPPYFCENCSNKPGLNNCGRKFRHIERQTEEVNTKNPPDVKSMDDPNKPSSSRALYKKESKQSDENENSAVTSDDLAKDDQQQSMECCTIFKEEAIISEPGNFQNSVAKIRKISNDTSLGQTRTDEEMENNSNKDTSTTTSQKLESNFEDYNISENEEDLEQQEHKDIARVVYMNDEENETSIKKEQENEDSNDSSKEISDTDDVDMSSYEPSDDDQDDDDNDDKVMMIKTPFKCSKCDKRFKYLTSLENHISAKHKAPTFQCPVCQIESESWCLFLAHVKTHESETCFACEVCGKIFKNDRQFMMHSKKQCLGKTCTCRRCLQQDEVNPTEDDKMEGENSDTEFILPCSSSSNISQTIKDVDNKSVNKCLYCNRYFRYKRTLLIHITKKHDKSENLKCFCGKTFKTRTGLKYHKNESHEQTKQFQCSVCLVTETRENLFIAHVMKHESETCFPCQVCGKIFTSNKERLVHWRTHIKERPFGCTHCFRRFRQELVYRNHMRCHLHYYCKNCETFFKSDKTLQSPFYCSGCKKTMQIKGE